MALPSGQGNAPLMKRSHVKKEEFLRDRTALVTGGGRRIGRAIALALADAGANIVLHYPITSEETEELRDELERRGIKSWAIKADFENEEESKTLIQRTREIAGSFDILINSASIFDPGTLRTLDLNDLLRHIKVNSWAPFLLSREFAMQIGHGKIVNLLDTRITGYDWAHVAYIISKQLLSHLTTITALAYAPDITVNAVAPGLILPPPGQDEHFLDQHAVTVPLKRHGDPDDIADAVLYLVTSDYVTGQVIYVDGGRHIMEYGNGSYPHN
jgi:pteridine reductase